MMKVFIRGMSIRMATAKAMVSKFILMATHTKANGLMICLMVRVDFSKRMAISMRVLGKMGRLMDMEGILHKMVKSTLDTGRMMFRMDMEERNGQINLGMRVHLRMG
jgi:hypothetical protein